MTQITRPYRATGFQLTFWAGWAALSGGCFVPPVQTKSTQVAIHWGFEAQVIGDALSINGSLSRCAYTDHGVKLVRCTDDTGRELRLRSAQIFLIKGEDFELELDAPDRNAKSVSVYLKFATRSGVQEVHETLPLDRSGRMSYRNQQRRWNDAPAPRESNAKK